jgi:hypothetical protein
VLAATSLTAGGCGAVPGNGTGMLTGEGGSARGGKGPGGVGGAAGGTGGSANGGGAGMPSQPLCGSVDSVSVKPIPADVLILLDASTGMNDDAGGATCSGGCGAASRWAAAVAAIERVVADTDATVNWGLQIFPDSSDACAVPGTPTVPVGPAHAAAIAAAIAARTSPNGGVTAGGNAPLRGAEGAAVAYLSTLVDPGTKLILLATAGAPSCPPGSSDPGTEDAKGAVDAITTAAQSGFATTVLGIATAGGPTDATLNALAIAGGTPRTGPPRYTPVADAAELTAPSNTLLRIAPPCSFAIPAPPTSDTSPWQIRVTVDGVAIPRDTSRLDGWDYDGGVTSLTIYGPTCTDLMTTPPHTVSIKFLCLI